MDQTQKSSKNPTYYYTSPTYPDSSSLKHVSPSTSSTSASTSSSPVTYSSSQKQECRPISLSSSYNDLRAPHTDHLQQQKQFYSYTSPSTSLAFVSLTEPRYF
ncbi:hypothetical protein HMI55_000869 [Coelomomyces lativittatus]|nr:hypothetical protein HMI55_000869 [Coelomomyces lativittatus]